MTPAQLRKARERLGLSQAALAEMVGISRQQFNKWEKGHADIPKWMPLALKAIKKPRRDKP